MTKDKKDWKFKSNIFIQNVKSQELNKPLIWDTKGLNEYFKGSSGLK